MPTVVLLVLAAIFFVAGVRSAHDTFRQGSRVGFVACLALALFTGYFALRASRAVRDLAELIDPVPGITDVSYVPTAAEAAAISRFLAAVPAASRFGTTPQERRRTAEAARDRRTDYWLVETAVAVDSVFAFYRTTAPRRGWRIELDDPPWLFLSRIDETLFLFVTDDRPRRAKVLYGFARG